jgi:hypothetical protein
MTSPTIISELRVFAEMARLHGLTDVYSDLIQDANQLEERRRDGTMANQSHDPRSAESELHSFTEDVILPRASAIQRDAVARGVKAIPLDVAIQMGGSEHRDELEHLRRAVARPFSQRPGAY